MPTPLLEVIPGAVFAPSIPRSMFIASSISPRAGDLQARRQTFPKLASSFDRNGIVPDSSPIIETHLPIPALRRSSLRPTRSEERGFFPPLVAFAAFAVFAALTTPDPPTGIWSLSTTAGMSCASPTINRHGKIATVCHDRRLLYEGAVGIMQNAPGATTVSLFDTRPEREAPVCEANT